MWTGRAHLLEQTTPRHDERLLHNPRHRCVPTVVGEGTQKRLIHRPADKLVREWIEGEHVENRVRLTFDPETVPGVDVVRDFVDPRLACVNDYVVVISIDDRTDPVLECPGEEVVPGGETVVVSRGFTFKE